MSRTKLVKNEAERRDVMVDHVTSFHIFGSSAVDLNDLGGSRKKEKEVQCYKR
jgi:hypothetical protein